VSPRSVLLAWTEGLSSGLCRHSFMDSSHFVNRKNQFSRTLSARVEWHLGSQDIKNTLNNHTTWTQLISWTRPSRCF
jgi:hypothetical protein